MLIFSVFVFLLVWVHGSLVQSWIILTPAISASILSRNKMLGHKTWFFFQRGHVSNSDLFYFSFSFGIWSLEKKELEVNCAIVCNGKEIFLWKEKSIFMLAHPMSTYRLFNSNLWHMYDKKKTFASQAGFRHACADIRIGTMSDAFRSDAIFCYCSNLNIQIDKAGNGRPRSFLPFRVFEWLPSFQLSIFSAKAPLGLFADCYSRPF